MRNLGAAINETRAVLEELEKRLGEYHYYTIKAREALSALMVLSHLPPIEVPKMSYPEIKVST